MLRTLALIPLVTVAIAGCSADDPYRGPAQPATATPAAAEPHTDAKPPAATAADVKVARGRLQAGPGRAVRLYAHTFVNWSYRSLERHQQRLESLSVGALSASHQAARGDTDMTLARDRASGEGTLAAVQLTGGGDQRRALVVAHQQEFVYDHEAIEGRRYRVYLARVTRTSAGWGVSAWQPQL